ncbi:MAG TPA: hypothetical protein VMV52_08675 [Candidatus Nanopelagicaceae bacterium]|nr:hypothetical protein [Candidatus Nanopelagicaceae bacterium]
MTDVTLDAITAALTGLSARQNVIADNTANLGTAGFLAGRVQFEDSLQQALSSGTVGSGGTNVTPTITRSLDPTGPDGNNVSLEKETLLGIETTLQYQLMLHAADDKFAQLRDVLRGS